jgi:hypothetical protein
MPHQIRPGPANALNFSVHPMSNRTKTNVSRFKTIKRLLKWADSRTAGVGRLPS